MHQIVVGDILVILDGALDGLAQRERRCAPATGGGAGIALGFALFGARGCRACGGSGGREHGGNGLAIGDGADLYGGAVLGEGLVAGLGAVHGQNVSDDVGVSVSAEIAGIAVRHRGRNELPQFLGGAVGPGAVEGGAGQSGRVTGAGQSGAVAAGAIGGEVGAACRDLGLREGTGACLCQRIGAAQSNNGRGKDETCGKTRHGRVLLNYCPEDAASPRDCPWAHWCW